MCLFVMHRGLETWGSNGRKNLKSQMAFGKLGVLCIFIKFLNSQTQKRWNRKTGQDLNGNYYYFHNKLYLNTKITYVLIKFVHKMYWIRYYNNKPCTSAWCELNTCNYWKLLHFPVHCDTCNFKNQRGKSNSKMNIFNVKIWFTVSNE